MAPDLSMIHRFVPAKNPATARTLLLLHGTGADENDLIPLGQEMDPDANLLSPRGNVNEHGMLRFFTRFPDGSFDLDDLHARTAELADFIRKATAHYDIDPKGIVAVGYSNGANIAASILLTDPSALPAAILMRPLLPVEPVMLPDLKDKPVLILGGKNDRMIPPPRTKLLIETLTRAGAALTTIWQDAAHNLVDKDMADARVFLKTLKT